MTLLCNQMNIILLPLTSEKSLLSCILAKSGLRKSAKSQFFKSHLLRILRFNLFIFNSVVPGLEGGRAFFNAVKEGDTVIFASDDEQDRILWVQAMYRATGQSHKPVPPTQVQKLNAKGGNVPQLDAPISQFCK